MASYVPAPAVYPIVREGHKLVVPAGMPGKAVTLPPPCVKCGAPANGKPVNKNFSWHHPALYLIILAGVLIYAIVAAIIRKRMRLSVPLCAQHAQRRSMAVTLAWVIPVVGVADAFILPKFGVDGGVVALITAAFLLTGIVIWAIVDYPIRPKYIDQYRGVFTGACEAYLQQFQQGPPTR
jgi:hypothetical protein